ncbi:acetylornithine deacetylase [Pochonia chlamydosporia 170]|uniref:Probable succinyl-diaminopimelate desuccinylase n=1 Tax=Pochonia chlamydosporia 170 TaxID=1380566 RepID=A0A179FSH6_METCM|nr:acetylornithine deacetylase [Pochonia chlamydosporia 170]OAQ68575.1 acetylornithine deacetylase [Pochonia chlamydosporia 170]
MASFRRAVQLNPDAASWSAGSSLSDEDTKLIDRFHRQFPDGPTRLLQLDDVAKDLGIKAVYLKDESTRFGLPSFKILGASWGTFRAITQKLHLPLDADLSLVKDALAPNPIPLFAASEGNHGRAVARMGSLLGVPAEIHVPSDMPPETRKRLEEEGAKVVVNISGYDEAMDTAREACAASNGLLVQDYSFDDYKEIPQWIVEGYMTMLREVDVQLNGAEANLVISPVGVGSFAQAVVSHYKRSGCEKTAVMTVEPDTAACLYKSLRAKEPIPVQTYSTIMAGLDCATLSPIAWPLLKSGVDASLTVSDFESHQASQYLKSQNVSAGPCGAAPLAALRRLTEEDKANLGLGKDSVVVLLCTEGVRGYRTPMDVSMDNPVALTQALVRIDSSNPALGSVPGPGETDIARYIGSWLEHRDIEAHWIEPTKGRPSIVGVVRGSGGGKSLMFNGHIDTVTTLGYDDDPLGGEIKDGKLYGRGADDMKCGVAAAMSALAAAKGQALRGDVIFTGVADEEATSIGTEQVLEAGWRADGAVVNEPTGEEIIHAHKGFVWLEVDIHGLASHGSLPTVGIDAITRAGHFLVELDRYSEKLSQGFDDPLLAPSVHASTIKGGEEESSYPALCTVVVERRTIAGESVESVRQEFQTILGNLSKSVKDFRYDLRVTFSRSPFNIEPEHPFAALVGEVTSQVLGRKTKFSKGPYWTDCALLADKDIPVLLWGPTGDGLHAKEEWVEIASIERVAKGLGIIAQKFCS